MYSITAKRMISGLVLKYLNGECFVIRRGYETTLPVSTEFNLTVPGRLFLSQIVLSDTANLASLLPTNWEAIEPSSGDFRGGRGFSDQLLRWIA